MTMAVILYDDILWNHNCTHISRTRKVWILVKPFLLLWHLLLMQESQRCLKSISPLLGLHPLCYIVCRYLRRYLFKIEIYGVIYSKRILTALFIQKNYKDGRCTGAHWILKCSISLKMPPKFSCKYFWYQDTTLQLALHVFNLIVSL